MRDDLKERLRKLYTEFGNTEPLFAMMNHWSLVPAGSVSITYSQGQVTDIGLPNWPDTRVEAFLDWAERTESCDNP